MLIQIQYFRMYISGSKFNCFIDSIKLFWEQWGKSSCLFRMIFCCMIRLIPNFWCTNIHTSSITSIIFIFYFITFLLQILPWKHTLRCWKIVIVNEASESVMLIWIFFLFFYILINTMHAHKIDYYCFCHHYFTVCALQVISFTVSSIQSTIIGNSEIRAVACFD